jgi:putative ABC transport system permease protein
MTFFNLLLRLYPASFRNEYGGEMRALFARQRRGATGFGVLGLWLSTIGDVLVNSVVAHLDILKQDLSYTGRMLGRSPGFAVTAILIVALGIGATTAAFSVTDFVLFRPLPFPEPHRLVKIWETTPGYSRMEFSAPNYRDWKAAARSYASMGLYYGEEVTLVTAGGEPRRLAGSSVSADLFPTLGVTPIIGRTFTAEDDRQGAAATVMLSYGLWQTEFGGDPRVAGRSLVFGTTPHTVVGVMPREFHFPASNVLFWTTNRFGERAYSDSQRTNNMLHAVARLRPDVTLEQARAEMDVITAQSRQQFPVENKDTGALVIPLADEVSQRSRLLLIALLGAAGCVLLIACANLANLLLARALARRRELAVRTAIGAGRERIVRQLMTESLLLAFVGGLLGIGVAVALVPLLSQLVPTTLPIAASPSIDMRVLIVAIGLTALTGAVFGLAPVLRGGGSLDLDGLREGARSGGGQKERLRSALVVAEIVASVVLLVSAGLLIRALLTVQAVHPGFKPDGVLTLRAELPLPEYRAVATREAFYTRVLQEVRALPGVTSAGFASFLPMSTFRGGMWTVSVKGDPDAANNVRGVNNVASIRFVTPGFFDAMAIPVKRGRDIAASDTRESQFVAVVSESFVRRYWPNDNPIGQRFTFAFAEREVVGVVGDVRFRGLERVSEPQVYLSSQQVPDGTIAFYAARALAVRTTGEPSTLAPSIRAIIRRADPKLAITELQTLTDMVSRETSSRTVQVRVLAAFAAIAFILAAVGIHGLLSFAVSQRTPEIGVRMALGASRSDILSMILRRCLALAVAGIVPGVLLAYAAGRSMEALLAGVRPADTVTLASAVGLTVIMTLLGSAVPALRAVRVDPIIALRTE